MICILGLLFFTKMPNNNQTSLLIPTFLCICLLFSQCKTHGKEDTNPSLQIHGHRITVAWNGVNRLTGGMPELENTNLKYHEVARRGENLPDSIYVYEFMHNFKDHVEIEAVVSQQLNSVVFYISPNNFHTQKSEDFVGIFFKSLPGFKTGKVFYATETSGAWKQAHGISTPKKMSNNGNQFFLYEYDDKTYAAILPLVGKGYISTLGNDKDMIGSKAYHHLDNHNENDIPVLAIAFGTEPNRVIDRVQEAAKGMSNQLDSLKSIKKLPSYF